MACLKVGFRTDPKSNNKKGEKSEEIVLFSSGVVEPLGPTNRAKNLNKSIQNKFLCESPRLILGEEMLAVDYFSVFSSRLTIFHFLDPTPFGFKSHRRRYPPRAFILHSFPPPFSFYKNFEA